MFDKIRTAAYAVKVFLGVLVMTVIIILMWLKEILVDAGEALRARARILLSCI